MPSLAVAIPTYNRADILEENLLAMRPALEELGIPVHVLDDSSNEDTARMVARLAASTRLRLHYQHNQPAFRHDANLIAALGTPGTDFVWLLGDGCIADDAGVRAVFASLADQDFVFVHSREGEAPPSERRLEGPAARRFIAARAWDFSFTGATIYSRRVIDWWRADSAHRPHPNFPHLSVILAFIAAHRPFSLSWIGQRVVRNNARKQQSYWLADAIAVWAGDWHRVITSNAQAFEAAERPGVLRSHSERTRVLGFKHLLVLRAAGLFNPQVRLRFGEQLAASSSAGRLGVAAVAALPRAMAEKIVAARPSWRRRYLPEGVPGAAPGVAPGRTGA